MKPQTRKRKGAQQKDDVSEFKAVMSVIKKILRERKISYRDLALRLGLSESGVKKIFSGEDCSFTRLSQIARTLGFRITDLLEEIEHGDLKSVVFTEGQQAAFAQNRELFNFWVKLVIERLPREKIQEEFGLNDAQAFRILKKLDDLGLIRVFPGDQVKLPPLSLVKDFGGGSFLSKLYQEWGMATVADLARPEFQRSGRFIIRLLKMKDETYRDFLSRILDVEREFLRRAIREMSVSSAQLKPVRWISMSDQQSYIRGKLS